jgi:signal transduction histidine kinase
MFAQARWRLSLYFAATVAVIVVVIGIAVFATARTALMDGVNDDLRARAQREILRPLAAQRLDPFTQDQLEIATAGGYFYAITRPDGTVVTGTANIEEAGLAGVDKLEDVGLEDAKYTDTNSSDGDDLRVYIRPIQTVRGDTFYLQVGRSIEPERQALARLLLILLAGGLAALGLALAAGYWLAGRALRPIQTAMDKQQEFVADASHELRTPLTLIRANAEILKRDPAAPVEAGMQSIDDIIQETDRLSALVGQMLTLARAGNAQTPPSFESVDLGELAEDTVREMRLLATPKEIAIEMGTNDAPRVAGDPLRLRELLTILLDNSLKYSDPGDAVSVNVRSEDGKAVLQVSDTGHGIPEEALPRIFERFYRVDKARSREEGGSGLGLSIARWIADVHRGTIGIESAPGRGTVVTVGLPLASG